MASRTVHHGGKLNLIKAPENTDQYQKSGPKLSKVHVQLRATQNSARRKQALEYQASIKKEIEQDVRNNYNICIYIYTTTYTIHSVKKKK